MGEYLHLIEFYRTFCGASFEIDFVNEEELNALRAPPSAGGARLTGSKNVSIHSKILDFDGKNIKHNYISALKPSSAQEAPVATSGVKGGNANPNQKKRPDQKQAAPPFGGLYVNLAERNIVNLETMNENPNFFRLDNGEGLFIFELEFPISKSFFLF
jgi:hypothetical protein